MYAIEKGIIRLKGERVITFRRKVTCGDAALEVEAGTTGYRGGCCRDAGGCTYMRIICHTGNFFFSPLEDEEGNAVGTAIVCRGDASLDAVMKALEFIQEAIDDQRCEVDD